MKKYLVIAALLLASPAAAQDFKEGRIAYQRGDYAMALREWGPLAEMGHLHAKISLGLMYKDGVGVSQDYAKAAMLFRKPAMRGIPIAQVHLGKLYTKGRGVPRDYVLAHMWFSIAGAKGHGVGAKNRELMASRMTPEQISISKNLARKWTKKTERRWQPIP